MCNYNKLMRYISYSGQNNNQALADLAGLGPGIYLLWLGRANDNIMQERQVISKEADYHNLGHFHIYKYGYSKDISRRIKEHRRHFGPQVAPRYVSFISPPFLAQAEKDVRRYLIWRGAIIEHKKYRELCILSQDGLAHIGSYFGLIAQNYCAKNATKIA